MPLSLQTVDEVAGEVPPSRVLGLGGVPVLGDPRGGRIWLEVDDRLDLGERDLQLPQGSYNATPHDAAQAQVQAQNAPVPSAALVGQLLKTPENQLTNADRAELGAALIHGTVSISTTGAAPSSVAPSLNTGTPAPSSTQSATPGAVGQCWGDRESTEDLTIAGGANVVSGSVVVDGWCQGPGHQAIVSVAGWQYPHWSWGPHCVGNDADYHGPDGSWVGSNSTWAHALHTFSGGVSYAFGCGYLRSGEDALRIAYNGYWDNYDDWGF